MKSSKQAIKTKCAQMQKRHVARVWQLRCCSSHILKKMVCLFCVLLRSNY